MKQPNYWNHNVAYYPWVKKMTAECTSILDVGCGDGSLALFLSDGKKAVTGIDPDHTSIEKALSQAQEGKPEFLCCSFEDYNPGKTFDAVVFVASIHHMDMERSLKKAKSLLSPHGKLLIVGLASPSTVGDHLLEVARVLPSKVLSLFHRMRSTEDLGIPTNYHFPEMNSVRNIVKKELPNAKIRYGLHYRYLLEWTKNLC